LEWADGEEFVPEDARLYMEVLRSLVPNLNDIIRQYIEESLVAYQRQAYFATAVMLGAVCEKAVYLLADAFLRSVQDPNEKKKLAEAMQRRSISRLFAGIQDLLTVKARMIPYDVTEGTEHRLLSAIRFGYSETRRSIPMQHLLRRARYICRWLPSRTHVKKVSS